MPGMINPLPPSDAVRKQKKNIVEDLFSSALLQLKKYHPSENLKFHYLGIFQSLKLRILAGKILPISLNPLPPSGAIRQQKHLF